MEKLFKIIKIITIIMIIFEIVFWVTFISQPVAPYDLHEFSFLMSMTLGIYGAVGILILPFGIYYSIKNKNKFYIFLWIVNSLKQPFYAWFGFTLMFAVASI